MFRSTSFSPKKPYSQYTSLGGNSYFDEIAKRPKLSPSYVKPECLYNTCNLHRIKNTYDQFIASGAYTYQCIGVNFDKVYTPQSFSNEMITNQSVTYLPSDSSDDYIALSSGYGALFINRTTLERITVSAGTDAAVAGVAFSPDGTKLLVSKNSSTTSLGIIDLSTWEYTTVYEGTAINCICWSPDGNYVYAGTSSATKVLKFDTATWQSATLGFTPPNYNIGGIGFSPNGAWLVLGLLSTTYGIAVYDTSDWSKKTTALDSSLGLYYHLFSFSPDGNYAVFGYYSTTTAKVLETTNWSVVSTTSPTNSAQFDWLSDSSGIVSLSQNAQGYIRVYKLSDESITTYKVDNTTGMYARATTYPRSKPTRGGRIAHVVNFDAITISDLNGVVLQSQTYPSVYYSNDIAISPDGSWVVRCYGSGTYASYRSFSTTTWTTLSNVTSSCNEICFRRDSKQVAFAVGTGGIKINDVTNAFANVAISNPNAALNWGRLKYSPDGTYVAVSALSSGENLKIYSVPSDPSVAWSLIATPTGHPTTSATTDISWSPDGTKLAVGHVGTPYVSIYDTSNWGQTPTSLDLDDLPTYPYTLVFNITGEYLLLGLNNTYKLTTPFLVFSVATGSLVSGHEYPLTATRYKEAY